MALKRNRFGSGTSAEQALGGQSLKGKTALVTGASSGIGVETARVLAQGGARVVLGVRSVKAGEEVAARLRAALPKDGGTLEVMEVDLARFASVRAFAEAYHLKGLPLHLLINNAGVMAPPLTFTADGFEMQIGTNHLGHFLLTALLGDVLLASTPARVVNLSSQGHRLGKAERMMATLETDLKYQARKYRRFDAYGDSKLANVLFTKELARRLGPKVKAFAVHPGVISTNLVRDLGVAATLFKVFGAPFLKSVPQGAATTVFAATAPELEDQSGIYLSDCNEKQPLPVALDAALAQRLWSVSEKRVGTTFGFPS